MAPATRLPLQAEITSFINLPAEGGYNIDSAAAAQGLYHDLFTWVGAGHVPYGTQTSVNPTYMRDVEAFLRYHFYQWNSRFTAALPPENSLSPQGPYQVYRLDGKFPGRGRSPREACRPAYMDFVRFHTSPSYRY